MLRVQARLATRASPSNASSVAVISKLVAVQPTRVRVSVRMRQSPRESRQVARVSAVVASRIAFADPVMLLGIGLEGEVDRRQMIGSPLAMDRDRHLAGHRILGDGAIAAGQLGDDMRLSLGLFRRREGRKRLVERRRLRAPAATACCSPVESESVAISGEGQAIGQCDVASASRMRWPAGKAWAMSLSDDLHAIRAARAPAPADVRGRRDASD